MNFFGINLVILVNVEKMEVIKILWMVLFDDFQFVKFMVFVVDVQIKVGGNDIYFVRFSNNLDDKISL